MNYKRMLLWALVLPLVFTAQANADGNELLQKCNKAVQFMDNPQALHQHEGVLAIAAFMDAYPCE